MRPILALVFAALAALAAADRTPLVNGVDGRVRPLAGGDLLRLPNGTSDGWHRFSVAATAGQTRTVTLPDASITVAGLNLAQTWTANQTIASGSTLTVAADTDATTTLGRLSIGSPTTDIAYIAHVDRLAATTYALAQDAAGTTLVNAASGQAVRIRVNNANVLSASGTAVLIEQPVTISGTNTLTLASDTDTTTTLGRARIGSPTSDYLYLSHIDQLSTTGYALYQAPTGQTAINATTGQNVSLRVNNAVVVTVAGSSVTIAQPLTVSGRIFGANGADLTRVDTTGFAEYRTSTGGTAAWTMGLRAGDTALHFNDQVLAADWMTVTQGAGGAITLARPVVLSGTNTLTMGGDVSITRSADNTVSTALTNSNGGTSAAAAAIVSNGTATGNVSMAGTAFAGNRFGAARASTMFVGTTTAHTLNVGTVGNASVVFGTNDFARMRITGGGNVLLGAESALATTATDGFAYIRGGAGAPTGVPSAYTGLSALYVDQTNNKLYFYSGGAWRDAGP